MRAACVTDYCPTRWPAMNVAAGRSCAILFDNYCYRSCHSDAVRNYGAYSAMHSREKENVDKWNLRRCHVRSATPIIQTSQKLSGVCALNVHSIRCKRLTQRNIITAISIRSMSDHKLPLNSRNAKASSSRISVDNTFHGVCVKTGSRPA